MSTPLSVCEEEKMDTGCGEHRTQCLMGTDDTDWRMQPYSIFFFTLAAMNSTGAYSIRGTLEGMPPYHGGSDRMKHAFLIHRLGSEEKRVGRDASGSILVLTLHYFSSLADRIVLGIIVDTELFTEEK